MLKKNHVFSFVLIIALFSLPLASAKKVNFRGFDKFVNQIIKEEQVPGVAVAVVQNGKIIFARGYGYRDLEKKLPVTPDTLFAIGSCSKAFTATALGMMVDQRKLEWDKPVTCYLPDFKLKDPFAAKEMTAVDLMCHRSGLPRHDWSWYNASASRTELYNRLPFLEPTASFRTQYQYNNFMFLTAGVLLEKLSGMSWEKFIQENIFNPLGMKTSNFSVKDSQKSPDYSLPYETRDKKVTLIPFRTIDAMGPAGSINSSVNEMSRWLMLNLNKGKTGKKQLISENSLTKIHSPQMIAGTSRSQFKEFFYSMYGLGWGITAYRGELVLAHGGGIDGFISRVSFLPDHDAGLVILTNSGSGGGNTSVLLAYNLYDRILAKKQVNWNLRFKIARKKAEAARKKAKKEDQRILNTKPSHNLADYTGRYQNPGYGILEIKLNKNELVMIFNNIEATGSHYHYDIFKFENKNAGIENMLASFFYNKKGKINKVAVPMQPGVDDILFTRMADEKMRSKEFLQKFVGQYQFTSTVATVTLKNGSILILTIPNQPVYVLVPYEGTEFTLKGLKGYSVEFILDKAGKVIEAKSHQPNGTFTAKKIK